MHQISKTKTELQRELLKSFMETISTDPYGPEMVPIIAEYEALTGDTVYKWSLLERYDAALALRDLIVNLYTRRKPTLQTALAFHGIVAGYLRLTGDIAFLNSLMR